MKPFLRDSYWQGVDHTESGIFIDDWELFFYPNGLLCSHIEVVSVHKCGLV